MPNVCLFCQYFRLFDEIIVVGSVGKSGNLLLVIFRKRLSTILTSMSKAFLPAWPVSSRLIPQERRELSQKVGQRLKGPPRIKRNVGPTASNYLGKLRAKSLGSETDTTLCVPFTFSRIFLDYSVCPTTFHNKIAEWPLQARIFGHVIYCHLTIYARGLLKKLSTSTDRHSKLSLLPRSGDISVAILYLFLDVLSGAFDVRILNFGLNEHRGWSNRTAEREQKALNSTTFFRCTFAETVSNMNCMPRQTQRSYHIAISNFASTRKQKLHWKTSNIVKCCGLQTRLHFRIVVFV